MKKFIGVFILAILLSTMGYGLWTANAAVPHLLNYQGRLTDKDNKPLEGSYSLTFRIYDAETAGNLLWEEVNPSVVIQKGVFSVLLGSITNLNLTFDKAYFLEIKVGNEVMSPRQRMASAPYAISAENRVPKGAIVMWSGSIASIPSGWALCDGTNGTPDLRDKFIISAAGVYAVGATGGEAAHTLTIAEMPAHTHTLPWLNYKQGLSEGGGYPAPGGATQSASTGNGAAHNNLPPYYALAYIMKL